MCSWFDDVLHRCTHALAVAQQLKNVQKFWTLDRRRETSTTWRFPCRDRESKVVEVMRINIRLQPSFIHRNTIYTDGEGSYKHMFEKVGGVVDAQGQRKSDYAARCSSFNWLRIILKSDVLFFNLVLASFKFSSTSLSKWLNADWTNNLRWQLFDQSGARKRRR